MSSKESLGNTLKVAVLLCVVCSVIVSTAAIMLRPAQEANRELDFRRNILAAANLLTPERTVEELFEQVTVRAVNLETGRFTDEIDPDSYDQERAPNDPALSRNLGAAEDIADIGRQEDYSLVYLVEDGQGDIERIVLPIRGYGLWSTLMGFIALEEDFNTVIGLVFYEHAETPGLGGEVDNPAWRAQWNGKQVYGDDGNVQLEVIKGTVSESSPRAEHQVDGLAGATLTSRGVSNLIEFWLGENGFKPFLDNLRAGEE